MMVHLFINHSKKLSLLVCYAFMTALFILLRVDIMNLMPGISLTHVVFISSLFHI